MSSTLGMNIRIEDIATCLPEHVMTNADFAREHPEWDIERVVERSGVLQRHVAGSDETSLDLAEKACQQLFELRPEELNRIGAMIFCTQTPDRIMPPNSYLLHQRLDLGEHVAAFDINLACSGFMYGLALARGLTATRVARSVLLVTADTYSKLINPGDRATRTLFGDGAAVTLLEESDEPGIIDLDLASSGKGYEAFTVPAGGMRQPSSPQTAKELTDKNGNVRSLDDIYMDGMGILAFVNSKVPRQIRDLLQRNHLTIEDIDLFVFHQASQVTLDSLSRQLQIPKGKEFRNLARVGNTVSASIPMALKDALDAGVLVRGQKVLLSGFGVGLSWGSAIIKF